MRFNLSEDPWLPVAYLDGSLVEVGLGRMFADAHLIRRIIGETPPMTAAMYRLVLALAHRAYGPRNQEHWAKLWANRHFPTEDLAFYLSDHGPRFELFDERQPFLQCPALAGVTPSSAAKLVPYRSVGNNTTLFDHTTSSDRVALSPAEAARWLVTLQAYDPGGLKTPYRKEKSSQAAPANWIGLVLLEGGNLFETLLLNMMPYLPADNQPRGTDLEDRPAWEAEPPHPEPGEPRPPLGWTDLLTWPSRRVWLIPRAVDGQTVVDQVVITPGTRLKAELPDSEWMAAYRRPRTDKGRGRGAGKNPTYGPWYPVRLQEARGVWRHSQELLLPPEGSAERHRQRPATLDHVAAMVDDHIPRDSVYTLRVFGQQLDSKSTVVHQVLEETLAAPVALLRAQHRVAGPVIGHSIELANLVGSALGQMEREHRAKFAASPSANLDLAYWPRLAAPFDQFLRAFGTALEADVSAAPATVNWARQVRKIADEAATRWAHGSPRQGRNLQAAGECYEQFLTQVTQFIHKYHGHLVAHID